MSNNSVIGYLALADQIRHESFAAIKSLQQQKIKTVMRTGDNKEIALSVSADLNIDASFYEVLPQQKLEIIKDLQSQGEFVAMCGDGINDAPALAQADIGIAIGSATDIAAETADIILVKSNPQQIITLIAFGKATFNKMRQNICWAARYNIIAIPLAAGVLAQLNIILSPAVGAILMSLSTIMVALNAQLLRRFKM